MSKFDQQGIYNWLNARGLPMYAALPVKTLPTSLREVLAAGVIDLDDFASLVLLGNAGSNFWSVFSASRSDDDDPVDCYSRETALLFARNYLGDDQAVCLFPGGKVTPPLQQLGKLAGWFHCSPLGMGIHPAWGLWHAYRAVVLSRIALPECCELPAISPCLGCTAPCIPSCPAQALSVTKLPVVRDCLQFRITDGSVCADRCLARLACPVAAEHQYPLAQIQHHYADPHTTWRRYFTDL